MDRLLLIPKGQYGYNTDYVQMVRHLAQKGVQIEVLCMDQGLQKVEPPPSVRVIYVTAGPNKWRNYQQYITAISRQVKANKTSYRWIIVSSSIYFIGAVVLMLKRLTPRTTWIMDVRTCSIVPNWRQRQLYDQSIAWSAKCFDRITIVSDLVAERLGIRQYEILPLGATRIVDVTQKNLQQKPLRFFYIGTFENRGIDTLIRAYDTFCQRHPEVESQFDLVGFSYLASTQAAVEAAMEAAVHQDRIVYHGRKRHEEVLPLFQEAAVGFSYIPMTVYFDAQPPTKTYEYIMNGIICIGTRTQANERIISEQNGVLIEDNEASAVAGMEAVLSRLPDYNSEAIAATMDHCTWEQVEERFYQFLIRG